MEFILVIVAAVSLALAAIMSTVAWRLLRDSKIRANNRAEALAALLSLGEKTDSSAQPATAPAQHALATTQEAPARAVATPRPIEDAPRPVVAPRPVPEAPRVVTTPRPVADAPLRTEPVRQNDKAITADQAWDRKDVGRDFSAAREAAAKNVGFIDDTEPAPAGMFTSDEPRQMSMGRWLALGAAGLVILIGAGTVYALNTGTWLSSFTGGDERDTMTAASTRQPLELLSLRHSVDEKGAFVVTGLVQNPAEGVPLRGVVAMVYLFDAQGRYFASGRATLDVSTLGAGEESPFVVKIPQGASVGRYRVGFRLDDGGVVAHVDRRGQTPAGTSGDTIDESGSSVATPAATPRRSEG